MVEITNGVRTDNIKGKDYSKDRDNTFRMVAVGTLYPYHGYDRVLKGSIVSISSICHSPLELAAEFEHAEVALKFCKPGENFIDYNSLGVFKLFAEVKNPSVLENMYQEILGALDSLSPLKHQSYLETLKFYVEQNGKIQKTAEENSTHRNTINYRIRKISELLNCDLQNGQVRYMIQTALLIGEYLGK